MTEQGESPVAGSDRTIGGDAVREATGRVRDEWFALLDAEDATGWAHAAIAARLVEGYGVDPWWAQHLTVTYEQARGLRRPGQRRDGSYEASVSRTLPLAPEAALRALAAIVEAETGVPPRALNLTAKHPTARFPLPGGGFVLASASPASGGRSSAGLTRGGLTDGDALADVKAELRGWLDRVAAQVGNVDT